MSAVVSDSKLTRSVLTADTPAVVDPRDARRITVDLAGMEAPRQHPGRRRKQTSSSRPRRGPLAGQVRAVRAQFALKKHVDRSEAALVGWAGLQRERGLH